MKILTCMCILTGCLAAQSTAKATTAPAAAEQSRNLQAANSIPKDAVETKPGFFRWTDKNGKVWTYRRTPFGVKRWPADAEEINKGAADKQKAVVSRTVATEAGDSIRFQESTPFGKRSWVRKKSELDATEQRIWEEQQKRNNAAAVHTAEKE